MVNNEHFVHVPLNLQQSIRIYFLLSHIFLHLLQINQSSDENDLSYKTIIQNINETNDEYCQNKSIYEISEGFMIT